MGKSIFETICSLSSEPDLGGGTIRLGLEKEDLFLFPTYYASGIEAIDKLVTDISSQTASVFNIPIRVKIAQEIVGGKCLVRVDVPELPAAGKPLYFKAQGLPRGAFRRIGSTDQRCTSDDLYAFFQNRSFEAPDRQIVADATWEDIDTEAIETYRRARASLNPLAEELNWSDEELLEALDCLVKSGGQLKITRTGLVSFGKSVAFRRIDLSNRIDYIRVSGKE